MLFRETENTNAYTQIDSILNDYIEKDILKFYGLTIIEYTNLTRYERLTLNKHAIKRIEKLNQDMANLKAQTTNLTKSFDDYNMG